MADVTLTYKGSDILELSNSGSATLKTGGKYCEDDIALEYVKPSGGGGTLIADVTLAEDTNIIKIDFDQSMQSYDFYRVVIDLTIAGPGYICPQINQISGKKYSGASLEQKMSYGIAKTSGSPGGNGITLSTGSNNSVLSSASAINYFAIPTYYDSSLIEAGSTVKIWGYNY